MFYLTINIYYQQVSWLELTGPFLAESWCYTLGKKSAIGVALWEMYNTIQHFWVMVYLYLAIKVRILWSLLQLVCCHYCCIL